MKTTVSEHDFCQAFVDCGREDSFSYEARKAIFEWLEEMDADCGTETELDPIAICGEFSEYGSAYEACGDFMENVDYNMGFDTQEVLEDEDEKEGQCLEYLQERTSVIEFNGGIVIQCF